MNASALSTDIVIPEAATQLSGIQVVHYFSSMISPVFYIQQLIAFAVLLFTSSIVSAIQIDQVSHEPIVILPKQKQKTTVRFNLSESAEVTLNIYDGRELLIRTVNSKGPLSQGSHTLRWDGKDQAGRRVPAEAYHYTLTARTNHGESIEYDISDLTGGEEVEVKNISWDANKRRINYLLTKPARVNIRIGLKNGGPLLKNLLNWSVRPSGQHAQAWNGRDGSNQIDLSKHKQLELEVQAFSLSKNTILVGPFTDQVRLIDKNKIKWQTHTRQSKQQTKQRFRLGPAWQPIESRKDVQIKLNLASKYRKDKQGLPIVSGKVAFKLDVDPQDRETILARRFEAAFFVDGQFYYENETGFIPMTWVWDAEKANPGIHYITANIRGYAGNFGTATIKLRKQD